MAARPAGGGVTPERVVKLLREEVAKTSQAATARATGLTLRGVQNYLKGIGDPTTATLQKLADYFGKSVAYLRGEETENRISKVRIVKDLIQKPGFCDNPQKIAQYIGYYGLKASAEEVSSSLLPQAIHELTNAGNDYEKASQETIQNIVIPILTEVAFFGGTKEDFINQLELKGISITGYDIGLTFADVEKEFAKIRKDIAKELGIFESTLLENAKAFLAIPEERREEALAILQREGIIPPTTDPVK
ncbi:Helix-turn-helix [Trichlorobacter thiogenes]|uniref:Helix-turn-helix n=1 Tax=Trichlorobacter thiogenes TaxID=115783 RepID=A0A1T4K086_9BACT|nr:helix-turn-helix transcriptional regulator [Trichlorobacter thiogenes]SJZ35922.1 Helix-turn-helix [Trichlorobacter thiogenes]